MFRVVMWAYRRWCLPKLVGYVWRTESDVYMIAPGEVERVYAE